MKKLFRYILLLAAAAVLAAFAIAWAVILRPNTDREHEHIITIPSGSSFSDLNEILRSSGMLDNEWTFLVTARLMRADRSVKPGYYLIEAGTNNYRLLNILRTGRQTPVMVTFNNIRTLQELAGRIGGQIEADSAEIIDFLSVPENYSGEGYTPENVISVFLPDTYEFYWTTDAEGFFRRMIREHDAFWSEERRAAASTLRLSPTDISILASIVDDEVARNDEKPRIAGVYLNRLRMGIPLQACPTIKYALNDFTIQRVLDKHLTVDSPYNTYKFRGLPPGPVRCPTKAGIDAVLNAEKHDYLYFAAKADFSGYHHFSRTLAEHNRYANAYQRELDRRKIYK